MPKSKKTFLKKSLAAIIIGIVLGIIVYYTNGARNFWQGFAMSYLLWTIVDWYDAFVIDILWFCHDNRFVIPGTEDIVADYHDYWFHIKEACKGMLIGLSICLFVGLVVQMIVWLA